MEASRRAHQLNDDRGRENGSMLLKRLTYILLCTSSVFVEVAAQNEFTPDNLKEYGIAPWYGEASRYENEIKKD